MIEVYKDRSKSKGEFEPVNRFLMTALFVTVSSSVIDQLVSQQDAVAAEAPTASRKC